MPRPLPGLHHVTAICADVQACVDFHAGVFGLRLVKRTVNFDVPDTYHLYFGDQVGTPGTVLTFFGWPHLPVGGRGAGQVGRIAYQVPAASLESWARRLAAQGLEVRRSRRFDVDRLEFTGPEGLDYELAGQAREDGFTPAPESSVPATEQIRGFHHVELVVNEAAPTRRFLLKVLGFEELGAEGGVARLATGDGGPGAQVELVADAVAPRGHEMAGTVHHVAWRAEDDAEQQQWQAVVRQDRPVTQVMDRKYFRSIYFREPGGILFEIATDGPGFTVDEPFQTLGERLQLPAQYEGRRADLERGLPPLRIRLTT